MATHKTAFDHRYTITPRNGSRSIGNTVDGGTATARPKAPATPEEAAAREADRADALAYLTGRGLADGDDSIAAILGLLDEPRQLAAALDAIRSVRPRRECAECGTPFDSHDRSQKTCGRKCGHAYRVRRNRERRQQAAAERSQ